MKRLAVLPSMAMFSSLAGLMIAAGLLAVTTSEVFAAGPEPLGKRPAFVTRALSDVPNAQAFVSRLWSPGLDDDYVPQGLAFANGLVALSAYRSNDPKQNQGPCRLFLIDPQTGDVKSSVDLPASCGHAGGVAALPDGRWVVADTRALYVVENNKVVSTTALKGAVRGSFADFDGASLWIGSYSRSDGKLWKLPLDLLKRSSISEADAAAVVSIPSRVQGLAFDRHGDAWLTVSGAKDGALLKLELQSGRVVAHHAMPAGIEDIAVDKEGRIWAVSEAGSKRWSGWATNFPVVFLIDPLRLK